MPRLHEVLSWPLYAGSLVVLVVTFFLPPAGFGELSVCSFKNVTGRSCFGCGMTRGLTSLTHVEPELAWSFHPFAFLLWPAMLVFALGLIPKVGRGLEGLARRHDRWLSPLVWALVSGFLIFGVIRFVYGEQFWL